MQAVESKNFLYNFLIQPRFRPGRHILFIVVFVPVFLGLAFSVFNSYIDTLGNRIYIYGLCLSLVSIAFVYYNVYFLVPRFLLKNKYAAYLIWVVISILIFVIVKYIVENWIFLHLGIVRQWNGITLLDGLSNLTLYTISIVSSSVCVLLKQWLNDTEQIDTLENRRLKSAVEEVKNLIDPAFLYKVLGYTSQKVKTDANRTSFILFKLSELLRYELYDCRRETVLAESDIRCVANYLSIAQDCSDSTFTYTLTTEGNLSHFIPPLLFMPFIQKIMKQKPKQLSIHVTAKEQSIVFTCSISEKDMQACDFNSVEQQLNSLYGNLFRVQKAPGNLTLHLKLC